MRAFIFITPVNREQKQLMLQVGSATYTLGVTEKTTIERGNQKVSLESLRVGEPATVKVQEDQGARVAISVSVNAH